MKDRESEFSPLANDIKNKIQSKYIIKQKDIRNISSKKIEFAKEFKKDVDTDKLKSNNIVDEIKEDLSLNNLDSENSKDKEKEDIIENEENLIQTTVEAIIEDKNIVGIIHRCRCGETSEIRLDFVENMDKDKVNSSDP